MVSTVIVALPAVDDKVNKISSEKVPHLTLAYLGEDVPGEDLATIVTYVQHAAAQLSPFGLSVEYRGELGPDQADVVFFEKKWNFERIADFRHHLLLDDTLRRAYDAQEQYPEWTPHLTLGYPESPAKEDDSDYPGIHYVQFDRIAVWLGDSEGPEFRLKYEETGMDQVMAMSEADRGAIVAANLFGDGPELGHFGVKGMKWGVRKSDAGSGGEGGAPKERGAIKRGATKANVALNAGAKVIEEGEKKLIFLPQENRQKAASATQAQVLASAKSINNKPQFKGKDIKNNPELKAEYFSQVESAAKKIYADELGIARTEAWADFLGTKVDTTGMRIQAASRRIRHANDGMETLLVLNWELDDLGQISGVTVPPAYLAHTDDLTLGFAHYGTKGMKWGVRNDSGHEGERAKTKVIDKADAKFEKSIDAANAGRSNPALHNNIVSRLNSRVQELNDKAEYADMDSASPALKAKYDKESQDLVLKAFEDGVRATYGSNASGTKKGVYNRETDKIDIVDKAAKHAEAVVVPDFTIKFTRDEDGFITDVELIELDEEGGELAHYGVKGMKWGVTNNADGTTSVDQTRVRKSLRSTDKAVTVTQRKAGTYVKARGGQRQTASTDAVRTQAARQKAKRSTTDSLSNKQLKDTIERMRLEQEFAKLDKKVSRKGSNFVTRLLQSDAMKQTAADLAKKSAAAAA